MFSVQTPFTLGGIPCPHLREVVKCPDLPPCPQNCRLSDWGNWSACTSACGEGVRSRERVVLRPQLNGGAHCIGGLVETQECHVVPCHKECRYTRWTNFSECSNSCGGGTRVKTRTIVHAPQREVSKCGSVSVIESCGTHPCPVPCEVTGWSAFAPCSATCGGGFMSRTRRLKTRPAFGGKLCPPLRENTPCNIEPCPIDWYVILPPPPGLFVFAKE